MKDEMGLAGGGMVAVVTAGIRAGNSGRGMIEEKVPVEEGPATGAAGT